MKKAVIVLLSIFTICFFTFSVNAFAEKNTESTKRIVLKLKNENAKSSFNFNSYQVKDRKKNIKVLEVPINDSKNVLKTLKQDPTIEFAEEEIEYYYFGMTNDQYFQGMQLKDFSRIKAPEAWDLFKPKKTPIVAVLDSGIDASNADLKNKIYRPYNVLAPGTQPFDDVGHGTHVAGIVGAETNNGIGVSSLFKRFPNYASKGW